MVSSNLKKIVMILGICTLVCAAALGQTTARLDGLIKDQTGAVIPGATVTITNDANQLSRDTVTNDVGYFLFVNVPPGTYTLAAELPGFKRQVQRNLVLEVAQTATIEVILEAGDITEEVTVLSTSVKVDQVSQSVGAVVTGQQITDLPLVSRNPMNLFYLQAGVNRRNLGFGGGRVDGLRMTTNNVQIEGIANATPMLTPGASVSSAPVIPEAMAEYKVVTSSAAAEHGAGGGAQVQLIYKSGSNEFHGSVWEFHRNKALNSARFFDNRQGIPKSAFIRHQYGFAAGGPIIEDKAFFHFTYEKVRERVNTTRNLTVYTDRFKQSGIFQYEDTNTGEIKEIDLKTVDPTRTGMDSLFTAFANTLPSPNNTDRGDDFNTGGFRYASDDGDDDWQFVLKGDYVFNDKHRMGISWAGREQTSISAKHIDGQRLSPFKTKWPAGIGTLTSSFTPNILNELRLGGTKRDWKVTNGNPARFTTIPLLNFTGLGGGSFGSRGGSANPSNFLPQAGPSATLTINDNLSWIRGDHNFKFGVDIRINRSNVGFGGDHYLPVASTSNSFNPANVPSVAGLNSSDRNRAQQLTNDVTGTFGAMFWSFQQISPDGQSFVPFETKFRRWRSQEYSFFVQDTWKFSPNLTLQLGFRWEVFPSHFEDQGIFSYPIDSSGGACVACIFGISGPGTVQLGLLPDAGRELYDTEYDNFAPNIGFTWDPFGDGKWSIAANYRVAYDRNPLVNTLFQDFSQEGATSSQFVFGSAGDKLSDLPAILGTVDPGVPFGPKPFDRNATITVWDDSYGTPYIQSWSLRVQREIMRDTIVEVAYVGNHGVGLPRAVDVNQVQIAGNGFLDGFLAAQANLAANGDPLVGADTGTFGQIWSVMRSSDQASQLGNLSRGEVAAVADFIDRSRASRGYLEAAGLPLNFFRANPQFNSAWLLGNNSHSTYHGLKLDVRRRFSDGLQFQANYSFSKAISDYEGGQSQRNSFRDNARRGLDKTRSGIDSRHIINVNGLWELPFGRGRRFGSDMNSVLDQILGGWQINGIFSYSSGQPQTISSSGRSNFTTGDSSTATFAGTDMDIASKAVTGDTIRALTPAETDLFSQPDAGSPGLLAQRAFNNPAFWVLDGSVFKSFRTPWFAGEDSEVQLRFEWFNLPNSTRFNGFSGNINSPNFGVISSARSPRITQVALKFIF